MIIVGYRRLTMHKNAILVTGAGGSIGSELCARLCQQDFDELIAVDISEYNLYLLEKNLSRFGTKVKYVLCDVRHRHLVNCLMAEEKPDIVYHAAALKHVPMLEYPHNTLEAFRTNILGTKYVLDAAIEHGAKQFLFVSTDKAVEPISMMGASKAFAEGYCREVSSHGLARILGLHVAIVRFGNVEGSSGSVLPLWDGQIARGEPVTVTHAGMTRWFMSIAEAVELVVAASDLSVDPHSTFMFDMGEPYSILELAKGRIAKSSRPETQIEFIGMRPGEKLQEKLYCEHEIPNPTPHPKIQRLTSSYWDVVQGFESRISMVEHGCETRNSELVKRVVANAVSYRGDERIL